jgi:hypothetical protein
MHRSKVEEIQGVQPSLSVNLNPCAHGCVQLGGIPGQSPKLERRCYGSRTQ